MGTSLGLDGTATSQRAVAGEGGRVGRGSWQCLLPRDGVAFLSTVKQRRQRSKDCMSLAVGMNKSWRRGRQEEVRPT